MTGRSPWRRAASLLLVLVVVACAAATVRGQDDDADPWETDPYFKGDRDAWVAAGYAPVRRFGFGDGHNTADVEQLLGEVNLLWVETAHFRLGSNLPAVKLERDEKAGVKLELERLAEHLPRLKPRAKTLDRHLRLHLYAQRLEDLYADVLARLGKGEDDFDEAAPHLGMAEKMPVLLLEKKAGLGRYVNRWGGGGDVGPRRLNVHRRGTMGFVTSWELFEGDWQIDRAFHAHVVWNVSQNLLCGYRGYTHFAPMWFQSGWGSWFARQISPEHPSYGALDGSVKLASEEWDWPPKVRARVGFGVYPTTADMLDWRHGTARPYIDYVMAWSKVDWLMATSEPGVMGDFVERLSAPIPTEPGTAVGEDAVALRCAEALEGVWGASPDALDRRWAAWVESTYPKK